MLKLLCNNKDISNGTMKAFKVNIEKEILVGRINGRLFACDNYCPHRGALLSKSKLKPSENRIVCYMHYFEYDLLTSKLEKIPDMWKNQSTGWKKSGDLGIYKTTEDKDGNVYVDLPYE
jgi:nitrite reductase/ring-hydroxylating ferredoxin subunit